MIFHQVSTERGCQSYFVACQESCVAIVIDPDVSLVDRYLGLAAQEGVRIHYVLDTHTHADHFSGAVELARQLNIPVIMHRNATPPFVDMRVDDGEKIILGQLSLNILHTPGHTADSICVHVDDRVFTGDTLLIGGCGRSDLPGGNAADLHNSLFNKLLLLDDETRVYPAHIYSNAKSSTIGEEKAQNPRLQLADREEFVVQMQQLTLRMPDHLSEALRTNLSGGKTVEQLISEAARNVSFMSLEEVLRRIEQDDPGIQLLDVREKESYRKAHIPGAVSIPRGQLELRVNEELPDPTRRIVVYCEYGRISTLATSTLREMGFTRAVALDQGMQLWQENGYPIESCTD